MVHGLIGLGRHKRKEAGEALALVRIALDRLAGWDSEHSMSGSTF